MKPCKAMKDVIRMHNRLVLHLSTYSERAWVELSTPQPITVPSSPTGVASFRPDSRKDSVLSQRRQSLPEDNVRKYLELVIGFANGMANWMMVSKRYVV